MPHRRLLLCSSAVLLALSCGNLIGVGDLQSGADTPSNGGTGSGGVEDSSAGGGGMGIGGVGSGGFAGTRPVQTVEGGTQSDGSGGLPVATSGNAGGGVFGAGGHNSGGDVPFVAGGNGLGGITAATNGGAAGLVERTGGSTASGGTATGGSPTDNTNAGSGGVAGGLGGGGVAIAGAAGAADGGNAGHAGTSGTTTLYSLVGDAIAAQDCGLSSTTWRLASARREPVDRNKPISALPLITPLANCVTEVNPDESSLRNWYVDSQSPFPAFLVNLGSKSLDQAGYQIQPKTGALHPGASQEYAAAIWSAPRAGRAVVMATFEGLSDLATIDVCILVRGTPVFTRAFNNSTTNHVVSTWAATVDDVGTGDSLQFAVGPGSDGLHYNDATIVAITILFTPS